METRTYKVYKFSELTKEAQSKALDKYRYINVDHEDWYEWTFEEEKKDLEEQGFMSPEIFFSGFCSQGDGACFDIKSFDAKKYITFHKLGKEFPRIKKDPQAIYGYIRKNSCANHYSHYNTRYFELTVEQSETEKEHTIPWWNKYEEEAMRFQEHVEQTREDLSKNIYSNLNNVYDSLSEDDSVKETLEANDYDFTEDGIID